MYQYLDDDIQIIITVGPNSIVTQSWLAGSPSTLTTKRENHAALYIPSGTPRSTEDLVKTEDLFELYNTHVRKHKCRFRVVGIDYYM